MSDHMIHHNRNKYQILFDRKYFFLFLITLLFDCNKSSSSTSNAFKSIPGQRITFDHLRSKSTDDSFNRTFDSSAQTQSFLLRPNHRTILDVFEGQSTLVLQGESLIDQSIFRRSQGHFNRERIPERIVHAKGFACYGQFQVTNPEISLLTKASVFAPGRITSLAVRFSTQLGERGSSDTPFGEVRGLGVKFYTDDGIYDLLMINLPVFFINDPQLFIHLNHAQKRDPRTDLYDSDNLWEFFSNRPEALNGMTFVYSDYGIPDGFRHMPAFSVNTFRLINHNGHQSYARFMLLPSAGIKNLNLSESISTRGKDPDYARRDLFEAIEKHQPVSWTLCLQSLEANEIEDNFPYNPFDATKLWPFDRFPPIEIGIMTLNRNVRNAFAENEQIALNPANLIPGIEPSPDRLLLGRLFAYLDTQFYRLGANHLLIPVNRNHPEQCDRACRDHREDDFDDIVVDEDGDYATIQLNEEDGDDDRLIGSQTQTLRLSERDGTMRTETNGGSLPNFYPNDRFLSKPSLFDVTTPPFTFSFDSIVLTRPDSLQQQYLHARQTYRSFDDLERQNLHYNLAYAFSSIRKTWILERMLEHLRNIDMDYFNGVNQQLFEMKIEKNLMQL